MDKKVTILMSIFFLSFSLFISVVLFKNTQSRRIGAQVNVPASSTTSIVLTFPLEVNVAKDEKSNITAFVRDADSKALADRSVAFTTTSGTVTPTSVISDADGKVLATFTCTAPGAAEIHAIIDGTVTIAQPVSIKCI